MKIEHYNKTDGLYIKLIGELDEHSSMYVRLSIDSLLDRALPKKLVIDMSELSFMDSTGVGVILGRYKKLKPRAVPMFIKSPKPNVQKVLVLSGIYDIIKAV